MNRLSQFCALGATLAALSGCGTVTDLVTSNVPERHSGRPSIDPQVATPEALRALPTMDAQKVATLVAARAAQPATSALPLIGRAFGIRVDIERPMGVQHREAVVRLTDHPQQIFWLLSWKDRT